MAHLLEVIACSVADAVAAEAGGAHRLEIVRDLELGGLALLGQSRGHMYRSRLTGLLLLPCCAAIFLAQVSETPVAPIKFRNVASAAGLDFVLENNPTAEKQLIAEAAGSSAVAIPVLEAQDFPFCSSEWHANVQRQTL